MNVILDSLILRRPKIEYVSPPICEAQFSSSGGPVIVLPDLQRLRGPTGPRIGGRGHRFLSWDNYPGQICFSIYVAVDPGNPNSPYNLISECIPPGTIALCSPGFYEVSAILSNGTETAKSSPIQVVGGGYTNVTLPVFPQTVAYNLYKSTGTASGPYHLYWYGFSGNSFEVCTPGCYRITVITSDGESPPSDPTCTDFTCSPIACPPGTGWNSLLCECMPCDLIENPCDAGFIWVPAQCSCVPSGGGGGDLTDILGPDDHGCIGKEYSSDCTAVGGTAEYTWSLVSGTIPDGLAFDFTSTSNSVPLTGTPTQDGDFNFRIRVSDVVGDFMEKDFTITVAASCCDSSTDWDNTPGQCRLRVKNYVDGLFPIGIQAGGCCDADADSGAAWDGTFSTWTGPFGGYFSDAAFTQMSGFRFDHAQITHVPGKWVLQVFYQKSPSVIISWKGQLLGTSPIGTYTNTGSCLDGCFFPNPPASVEIEAYSL